MKIHHPNPAESTATAAPGIPGRTSPRAHGPSASTVLEVSTAKVVAFEFAAGQELREHAAAHPILVQVLRGAVEFEVTGDTTEGPGPRTIPLAPGDVLHLTPYLRHAVRATEDTTLSVTMLLGHTGHDGPGREFTDPAAGDPAD